jgi:hypothetical protein
MQKAASAGLAASQAMHVTVSPINEDFGAPADITWAGGLTPGSIA